MVASLEVRSGGVEAQKPTSGFNRLFRWVIDRQKQHRQNSVLNTFEHISGALGVYEQDGLRATIIRGEGMSVTLESAQDSTAGPNFNAQISYNDMGYPDALTAYLHERDPKSGMDTNSRYSSFGRPEDNTLSYAEVMEWLGTAQGIVRSGVETAGANTD